MELPQWTLAAMLGVQRPSLNKVLKDMEGDRLIRISYHGPNLHPGAGG